jgi:transcriptional regulator with XRE-family HTH domain
MRGTLPGQDVSRVREALGLSVAEFSTVLGVHPSSVHRWEAAGKTEVPIEGVAWPVVSALRFRMNDDGAARRNAAKAGEAVAAALITGGILIALGLLLAFAVKGKSA